MNGSKFVCTTGQFIPWVLIIQSSKFSHSDTEMSLGLLQHLLKGNKPEQTAQNDSSKCVDVSITTFFFKININLMY